MNARAFFRFVSCAILAPAVFTSITSAQEGNRRGRGTFGDWVIKMEFNGQAFESILSFSRNDEGQRSAQWISFFGVSDLKDVKLEDGKLSFVRERRTRDGETRTSKFEGTIQDGKLTGVLSGDGEERKVEGSRRPRLRRAVGNWDIKFKIGEREIANTLVITQGKENQIDVDWKSDRVEHTISKVSYERGKLSFHTKAKLEDREWESTFEGTIEGDSLTGAIKSDRGEVAVEGKLAGAAAIGTWNLDVSSERGERKQRLVVNRDLTGLYGSTPVKKVKLEDGKLSFKVALSFGDREFEMDFAGNVKESTLTGELTTSRGTSKVTGKKVARQQRGRPRSERREETL